ncbi:MAG: Ni,Fe-hydrogenase maturation factor [Firmicutes bacterium HGW-Firmicutes-8]|nr:MAG: Ni,Fe-hydrogenase maturation factor [Firmicutes bacterium HGW-Firmicutes-8]
MKILVLGVGNDLLTDEGVGVHVVRELIKEPLPANVTVYNGGVSGIDLLDLIQNHNKALIIDAIDAGAQPGAVFRFQPAEIECLLGEHKTSLHQVDLFDTIKIARFTGKCPQIVIIGIQPFQITWGLSLTPEMLEKLPGILALVKDEIEAMSLLPAEEGSEGSGY